MSSYSITAETPGSWLNWTDAVSWTISFNPNGELVAVHHILNAGAMASGVNNTHTICGEAWAAGQPTEALIWTDTTTDILDRSKFVYSARAADINDDGVVIGTGTVLIGPDAGKKDDRAAAYLFRVEDDRFIEVHGMMQEDTGKPSLTIWQRRTADPDVKPKP